MINPEDYEALTVVELKEMADSLGVEIPHDARKAEIIEALAAADRATKKGEDIPQEKESPEGRNIYEYQMSSTETALISPEDYKKLKLTF